MNNKSKIYIINNSKSKLHTIIIKMVLLTNV